MRTFLRGMNPLRALMRILIVLNEDADPTVCALTERCLPYCLDPGQTPVPESDPIVGKGRLVTTYSLSFLVVCCSRRPRPRLFRLTHRLQCIPRCSCLFFAAYRPPQSHLDIDLSDPNNDHL